VGPRAGLDAVGKRKSSYSCRQSNPGRPDRSSVTILTELPSLLFWVFSTCNMRDINERFGGTYCLHLQGSSVETGHCLHVVKTQKTERVNHHRRENAKCHKGLLYNCILHKQFLLCCSIIGIKWCRGLFTEP